MNTYKFTVSLKDVIYPHWKLINAIGQVLVSDIGKRVYDVGGVWSVENNHQRSARKTRGDMTSTERANRQYTLNMRNGLPLNDGFPPLQER